MNERRSYFRINETIALEIKPVSDTTAHTSSADLEFPDAASLKLYSEIRKIDADNALLYHQIRDTNRTVAEYLQNLNRKLDLLGQQILQHKLPAPPAESIRQVNLSEGGIAFGLASALPEGSYFAIRIIFLPSNAGLASYAKVTRCAPTAQNEFQIAARFHNIGESQQQIIGQHIMRSQMAQKRQHKATP